MTYRNFSIFSTIKKTTLFWSILQMLRKFTSWRTKVKKSTQKMSSNWWTITILKARMVCAYVDFNSIFYLLTSLMELCIFIVIKYLKICAMCYFIIVGNNHMMNFIVINKKSWLYLFDLLSLVFWKYNNM